MKKLGGAPIAHMQTPVIAQGAPEQSAMSTGSTPQGTYLLGDTWKVA